MTESKEIITYDIKEFLHEIFKESSKKDAKVKPKIVTVVEEDSASGLIEKRRALKRWKESVNYYYLHPEKFKFDLKNL